MKAAYKWAWVVIALLLIAVLAFRIVYPLTTINNACKWNVLYPGSDYKTYQECVDTRYFNYYSRGNL